MKCNATKAKLCFRKYFCWNFILYILSVGYPVSSIPINLLFSSIQTSILWYISYFIFCSRSTFSIFSTIPKSTIPKSTIHPFAILSNHIYLDLWHTAYISRTQWLEVHIYFYAHKRSYASNKFLIFNPRNIRPSFIHTFKAIRRIFGASLRFIFFSFFFGAFLMRHKREMRREKMDGWISDGKIFRNKNFPPSLIKTIEYIVSYAMDMCYMMRG